MGMYTRFIIECKLRDDTPCDIVKCLQDMVDDIENELFAYTRNPLNNYTGSNSYTKSFGNLILKAHGDIKNNWGDIGRFIEFIKPYVEIGFLDNDYFAKSLYEGYDDYDEDKWIYYGKPLVYCKINGKFIYV